MPEEIHIFWFRRDLRIEDNRGLSEALARNLPVLPLFIFDKVILSKLKRNDARVQFILEKLEELQKLFQKREGSLVTLQMRPLEAFAELCQRFTIKGVFANEDYEPYARNRDDEIKAYLQDQGIPFHLFTDQVVFAPGEIVKGNGTPYTVFTPFKKRWLDLLTQERLKNWRPNRKGTLVRMTENMPSLKKLGFAKNPIVVEPFSLRDISRYYSFRNLPAKNGTSKLGPHLRFGTISIREIIRKLPASGESFLSELIWREFFMHILYYFPHVVKSNFKPKYNQVSWAGNKNHFEAWKQGKTGFPLVDAGLRELNQTGYMHGRVRMVAASFLCKHLLLPWQWGEAYFAEKLLDYELASNNGNWQWCAGTGCDAAPYFRIFSPEAQQKKFDPDFRYIKKWVPEYRTSLYPAPIVDHRSARVRALNAFKKALN